MSCHDLAKPIEELEFCARVVHPKSLFLRCHFEKFAKSRHATDFVEHGKVL